MDKSLKFNQIIPGAIGDIRIYEKQGRMVTRVRHNSVKPQNKTPDSLGNKARMMNVVKSWSAFEGTLQGNFELKPTHQNDYNAFLANNLPNARVFLTQQEAKAGAAIVDQFVISRGSLSPSVEVVEKDGFMISSIAVGKEEITLDTPLSWLSSAIVGLNKGFFRYGDEILFYRTIQGLRPCSTILGLRSSEIGANIPHFCTNCISLPITKTNGDTLRQHFQAFGAEGLIDGFRNVEGHLACEKVENSLVAWVQRRPQTGKVTQVSTQMLCGTNNYLAQYGTDEARERAVESYQVKPNYSAPQPQPVVNPFEVEADAPEVTIQVIGGTGGGTYRVGTRVTLQATPQRGYLFDYWSDGDCSPQRTVVAFANITYQALFKTDPNDDGYDYTPEYDDDEN